MLLFDLRADLSRRQDCCSSSSPRYLPDSPQLSWDGYQTKAQAFGRDPLIPVADQFEFVDQVRETIPILVGQIPVVRPADPLVAH